MPGLPFTAIASHSILRQIPLSSRRTKFSQPLSLVLRVLGSGLFFLTLLLFPILAFSADVTLAWEPNTETDLEGYGVYFKKDAPGPPYDLFGYVTLQELGDPNYPTFTLTGLQAGSRYYFAATAYDTAGNESGYSNQVCAEIGDQVIPCASADTGSGSGNPSSGTGSGGSSGGGSGGGAGCFIESSLDHSQPYATILALSFLGMISFLRSRMFFRKNVFNKQPRRVSPFPVSGQEEN